ncbi:hypothetical protein ARALYDRAFT_319921 [Arabidopsis lyrata subsp. lyrata]|uniref:Pentatricopeptide repeat-containing protein n=1 Tax=Arabidopsis lyrata subsp. lyrata TaxID=81972 RepID=D7L4J4_ARALL|nr:hypothetical protein ARALYDRAFT_319921 [Arabidopsis lyrata subsp. lyrata]
MKHLLRQPFSTFFWKLPCRRSFVHFPKTIPSPELIDDTLKRRIERVQDSTVSITPLLREWCQIGNQTALSELRSIITSLHRSNRFFHALQVSDWMIEQKAYKLSSMDFERRLYLTAKVCGVEEAAKFFETVPAEDHDMVVKLLGEMDEKKMQPQGLSFDKLLTSYSMASDLDVQGMEKFLSKWEVMIQEKWTTFYFPGLVYLRAGFREKGLALLRRSEPSVGDRAREIIYGCLMTAYCSENLTEDVYRLWNLAKDYGISFDSSKCSDIVKAFMKKGDLDEVMEEWDECPNIDLMDFGLQHRCMKEEAEKIVDMFGKKESKWESLALKVNNLVEDEDDKEEERRKRVAEAMEGRLHDRWNPKSSMALSAYACVQYVEGRRDMESTADILRLLNKREQVLHAMDKDRLSLKMVEAMRGGGYVGGDD